jgi:two-component system, NarL family, invasion response regulator UvrY
VTSVIELLIVDDHAIVRQGLRQIVSETEDIVVAGEAESGASALRLLREKPFAVVLLDISMPDRNGIDVLKQIHHEFPKLAVIMLTMHAEDEFGVRALKAGASGYLTKQSAPSELVIAIRQVASGRKYISGLLAEELARHVSEGAERPPHENLSDREFQTLCLIASGKSLSQVAAELCLSPKTVSVYRARLLAKLNLKNNAELTHYAIRNQLVH